jgi:hypothetical protein
MLLHMAMDASTADRYLRLEWGQRGTSSARRDRRKLCRTID